MLLLTAQIVVQIARGFVARAGVLFQAACDRPAQRRGNLRIDGLRLSGEDGRHGFHAGLGRERPCARRQLIENDAKGKLVGAVIRGLATHLLRAHIPHRAQHRAWVGIELGQRGNPHGAPRNRRARYRSGRTNSTSKESCCFAGASHVPRRNFPNSPTRSLEPGDTKSSRMVPSARADKPGNRWRGSPRLDLLWPRAVFDRAAVVELRAARVGARLSRRCRSAWQPCGGFMSTV